MAKLKTVFVCQECGTSSGKWLGRCPECDAWNSLVEERQTRETAAPAVVGSISCGASPRAYADVQIDESVRTSSGLDELDRVLGGGIVAGSLVLLGGDPGIGKSTLLLQVAAHCSASASGPVLYVSGEESPAQIKLRGERLGIESPPILLFSETHLDRILEELEALSPGLVILDSVQTVYSRRFSSAPGSISQVREVTAELLYFAKSRATPVFLIGHVNKEGNLAGPKALEHMVDTVLHFEGDRHHAHRVVRAVKNRFGAAGELGVFEMTGEGLVPVTNPSGLFLSERPKNAPGSAVVCAIEGTRPILLEVQSLVSRSTLGYPRRVAVGFDVNRVSLLLAVLEKRATLPLSGDDVFVKVAGGLNVKEPFADLGVVASIISSARASPVDDSTVFIGEVGLAGEVRAAQQVGARVSEVARLGFERVVLPSGNCPVPNAPDSLEVVGVRTIAEVMELIS